ALEDQRAYPIGKAQRVRQREPRAHRVAGEEERRGSERRGERVERVAPGGGVRARSMPGKIGSDDVEARVEMVAEVIERSPRTGEPMQERESGDHGALPRAEATAA